MKFFIAVLATTLAISPSSALEDQKDLLGNPLALFKKAIVPALSHSEAAKIQTTWRGFYLRADNQAAFKNERSPSESGIYLDVEVRDAKEIPAFIDSLDKQSGILTRTVRIPSPKSNASQGLVITLIYGSEANSDAIKSIEESIADIERSMGLKTEPPIGQHVKNE